MKHNLKQKYKWKERSSHFTHLRLIKLWYEQVKEQLLAPSIWDKMNTDKSFTNSDRWPDQGEGALKGNSGTTNPLVFNKIGKND